MSERLSEPRAYHALRTIVEEAGGEMRHERKGQPPGGTWLVNLRGKQREFHSNGGGYPELDSLFVPRGANPQQYTHYTCDLVEGGKARWLAMLR